MVQIKYENRAGEIETTKNIFQLEKQLIYPKADSPFATKEIKHNFVYLTISQALHDISRVMLL